MNKPRLIDENELIEWLTKPTGFRTNCEDCPTTGCIDCVIEEAIKNTPTAYDIDKVVEKLEESMSLMASGCKNCFAKDDCEEFGDCGLAVGYKAIEIVKGGAE